MQPAVRHVTRIEIVNEFEMAEAAREIARAGGIEHLRMIARADCRSDASRNSAPSAS